MEERNRRKVLRGTVVSDKMDKTIVVEIVRPAISSDFTVKISCNT